MKRKGLLMLIGSVCLALMLAVPLVASCAPATPEEAAEEITELEAKLATEKSKVSSLQGDVSDLEAEIAGLKAPAKKVKLTFTCFEGSGPTLEAAEYVLDTIESGSEGLIETTLLLGEGPCPVEEYLEATRDGMFDMCLTYDGYYLEKIPALLVTGATMGCLKDDSDFLQWLSTGAGVRY